MIRSKIDILKKYYVNFRGWSTKRKIVVIESDDWGAIRIRDRQAREDFMSKDNGVRSNLFCKYDTLESLDDIRELFNLLKSYTDRNGVHPVITACAVVANPDFNKIRQSNFTEYFYEDIRSTYNRYYGTDALINYWKTEGIQNKRLLIPQFHGREHINYRVWLRMIQNENSIDRYAFDQESILGIRTMTQPLGINGYMAAFEDYDDNDMTVFDHVISSGTDLFEEIFGFRSVSFVAPCAVRNDSLDSILVKYGLQYHQMGQQFTSAREGHKIINRFWGDTNTFKQLYWRRNSMFEPYKLFPGKFTSSVLDDARIAFSCGKPLVISSHRINYVSSLEPTLRDYTLDHLDTILKALLKKYPEIEFMSSDQLGDYMSNDILR